MTEFVDPIEEFIQVSQNDKVSNLGRIQNINECIKVKYEKNSSHGWMRQGNFVDEWMLRWHSAMGHDSVTHGRKAGTGSGSVV